jgi:hypothetical protein
MHGIHAFESESMCWAEALEKLRSRPCGRIDGNWISFQLANSTPPLSVTDSAFAPSARIPTCIKD